jgi:hypothetical protein
MTRIVTLVAILLLCAIEFAAPSFSQTAGASDPKSIDLTAISVALINQIFAIVIGVATYLINARVKNQQMATLLSNAVENGLGIVQRETTAAVRRADPAITVANPDINAGVQYILQNAPEAISHFKISPERIAQKLEAKLGVAEIATNLAATASPAPLIVDPLEPVQTMRIAA